MSLTPMVLHDPDAGTQPYSVDWNDWVGTGVVTDATWTASPTGLTIIPLGVTGNVATCKVSGGTLGQVYALTCRATATGGIVDDRTTTLRCGAK